MTKWIRSTTNRTYKSNGYTIKRDFSPISEGLLYLLNKNKVIASLIKAGAIIVSNIEPKNKTESALEQENKLLKKELEELKKQKEVMNATSESTDTDTESE